MCCSEKMMEKVYAGKLLKTVIETGLVGIY